MALEQFIKTRTQTINNENQSAKIDKYLYLYVIGVG